MHGFNYSMFVAGAIGFILGSILPAQYVASITFCVGMLVGISFAPSFGYEAKKNRGWFES